MAENDLLAAAKGIVESYLEASMVPDPARAATFVANDFAVTFTGGAALRLDGGERRLQCKALCLGEEAVLAHRCGARSGDRRRLRLQYGPSLRRMAGRHDVRDEPLPLDRFVVRGGKIVSTDVWNDSAEILLARAGLAEAPL